MRYCCRYRANRHRLGKRCNRRRNWRCLSRMTGGWNSCPWIQAAMPWALAMRRAGLAGEITGYARSAETRRVAAEIGLVDRVFDSAAGAVAGADLVVLCVPVGAMEAVAAEIGPHLKPGATVTDVGSVKQAVVAAVATGAEVISI